MVTNISIFEEKLIEQFNRDGYLLGGQVLDENEVEILREEIERVIRDHQNPNISQPVLLHNMNNDPKTCIWQIVNIWEASKPFRDLIFHSKLVEESSRLLDAKELRIWHDQIQYKPAGTGGVNMWHQDNPYWPILKNTPQVTAWIALDDVDETNGCMSMIPGSHLWGDHTEFLYTLKDFDSMPNSFKDHPLEIKICPVKKGYVHYHHSMTWHGSPANRSGRPRRAIAIHYMSGETRYNADGVHIMKKFVTVKDGERLQGEHFPIVWEE